VSAKTRPTTKGSPKGPEVSPGAAVTGSASGTAHLLSLQWAYTLLSCKMQKAWSSRDTHSSTVHITSTPSTSRRLNTYDTFALSSLMVRGSKYILEGSTNRGLEGREGAGWSRAGP
jgi:hypothetical protein